jgi:hypothetical protein
VDKIDYRKVFKESYGASAKPVLVDVPPMQFLMIDGAGDPARAGPFQAAVDALYSVAWTLKSLLKKGPMELDFGVMPLEGLWWADDMSRFHADRDGWQWTLMIMQPPVVSAELAAQAAIEAQSKKRLPLIGEVRLARFEEGKAVQLLHTGPFADEGPAVERLHAFAAEQGFALAGKHHEIYLSDARRTVPGKLKTILRQPIRRL